MIKKVYEIAVVNLNMLLSDVRFRDEMLTIQNRCRQNLETITTIGNSSKQVQLPNRSSARGTYPASTRHKPVP